MYEETFDDDRDDHFDEDEVSEDDNETYDTVPCPYCREPIHEDTIRCPHCEQYISTTDAPRRLNPWWIVLGVVLCLAIVAVWVTGG